MSNGSANCNQHSQTFEKPFFEHCAHVLSSANQLTAGVHSQSNLLQLFPSMSPHCLLFEIFTFHSVWSANVNCLWASFPDRKVFLQHFVTAVTFSKLISAHQKKKKDHLTKHIVPALGTSSPQFNKFLCRGVGNIFQRNTPPWLRKPWLILYLKQEVNTLAVSV